MVAVEVKPWLSLLLKPARRGLLGRSAWGLADQAFISAMTFGTMVALARHLGPAEFGTFSLAYLALLLANSLQTALVTQPHNVLGSPLEGTPYDNFTTSLALGQLVVAAGFTVLALAGVGAAAAFGWESRQLIVALAVAIPTWQLQEFARRVLYTERRVAAAFWNDVLSYGGQLVIVLLLIHRGRLTAELALYAIAGTSAVAALAGVWTIRPHLGGRLEPKAIRESWAIGKWFSAGTLANWLASQIYPVLTAGILGVYATGVFRALQNLIAPTQILANAFQMMATPQASREYARGGTRAVDVFLGRGSVLLAIPLVLYVVLVGVAARLLITFFYSSAYADAAAAIWPLGLAYLLSYAGRVLGIGLAAGRESRPLFYAQLAAAAATFSVGMLLIRLYGLVGAAFGAVATQTVQVGMLAWYLRRRPTGA